jgi:hypothetical protein
MSAISPANASHNMRNVDLGNLGKRLDGGLGVVRPSRPAQSFGTLFKGNIRDAYAPAAKPKPVPAPVVAPKPVPAATPASVTPPVKELSKAASARAEALYWAARERKVANIAGAALAGLRGALPSAVKSVRGAVNAHPWVAGGTAAGVTAAGGALALREPTVSAPGLPGWQGVSPVTDPSHPYYNHEFNGRPSSFNDPSAGPHVDPVPGAWDWLKSRPMAAAGAVGGAGLLAYLLAERRRRGARNV